MSKIARYYQNPGIVSFLVMTVLSVAAISLLALLLVSLTGWPFSRALDVSSRGICIFLLLGGIGWIVTSQFRAGPIILDVKAVYPGRGWFIAGAVGYLFLLSLDFDFGNVWSSLGSQIFSLLLVVYLVILALGRLQVRKRGIWLYTALIPGHKIESYALQNGMVYFRVNNTKLWANNPSSWARKGYKIPGEHVEAFEAYLLEQNIPNIDNAESVVTA